MLAVISNNATNAWHLIAGIEQRIYIHLLDDKIGILTRDSRPRPGHRIAKMISHFFYSDQSSNLKLIDDVCISQSSDGRVGQKAAAFAIGVSVEQASANI